MWEDYAHRFRLRAHKVMSQSVVLRQLEDLPRYRLVIIDESHNFRNREGKIYQAIRGYLDRNDSKVILLTATPYNKTYLDLGSQLRLFLNEQYDLGIRPEAILREVGDSEFSLRNPNTPLSSLAAFEKSEHPDDWREIMRLFLVRRTRSFIIANYAEFDDANGRPFLTLPNGVRMYFPTRSPHSVKFRSDPSDPADPVAGLFSEHIVDIIDGLDLPRYGLSLYQKAKLPLDLKDSDRKLLDDLSRAGKRLKGFCRTNLFKRLESSGHSFILSIHRHILRNYLFLHALENKLPLPIGQQDASSLDPRYRDAGEGELDLDDEEEPLPPFGAWDESHYRAEAAKLYQYLSSHQSRRYRWLRTDVFKPGLPGDLLRDAESLHRILTEAGEIAPAQDYKLQALIHLLGTEAPKEKFLLFSQFADTAHYLSEQLHAAGIDGVDCVTGNSENPARQAWRFSPESNDRLKEFPSSKQSRVLVATDVLSEGQNLQDASRVSDDDLAELVTTLHRDDRLVVVNLHDEPMKEPRILCSLGLAE